MTAVLLLAAALIPGAPNPAGRITRGGRPRHLPGALVPAAVFVGVVVFRGFPGNSVKQFTGALARVVPAGGSNAVGIDPRLFRAFAVTTVPTYVVTSTDFDLCDGFDCTTAVPPHDRMSGNVSAAYALETFARGGGPGALIAAQHLARLERPAP